jgi:hypothetical protein
MTGPNARLDAARRRNHEVGEAKKIARVVGSAKCVCGVTLGPLFLER